MKAGVTQKSHGKRDMGFFFLFSFFFPSGGFLPLLSASTTFGTHCWDVNSIPSVV